MAWTTPRTYIAAETLTAAILNTHVRDNETLLKTEINNDGTIDRMMRLSSNAAAVQNVSTGETDMLTYTMPANTLASNNQALYLEFWANFAGNNNTKTLKVYLGSTSLTMYNQGANSNGQNVFCSARIVRLGATSQNIISAYTQSANGTGAGFSNGTTENLAANLVVKFTATGGATSDIQADWQCIALLR